jgi:hypothetical protein
MIADRAEKLLPQRTPVRLPFRKLRVAQGRLRNTEEGKEEKIERGRTLIL